MKDADVNWVVSGMMVNRLGAYRDWKGPNKSASVYQSRSCTVRGARRTLNREQGKVGQDFLDKSPMQSDELKMEIAYGERRGLTPQSETQV